MCSHLGGTDLGGEVSGVGVPGEVKEGLPVSECQLCFGTAANGVSVSMRTCGRSFSGDATRNIQGCASSSLATQPAWCGLPVVLPLFGHARDLKHRKGKESGVILGIH